jgi:hypothetical protein
MIVEQSKFGFCKVFVPNDTEAAYDVAQNRGRYSRITIMSLESLELPGFQSHIGKTGIVSLDADYETVASRFRKTVRNEISRTHRDPDFSWIISNDITDEGYALLCDFFKARGMASFPRSTYQGCMEFLAYEKGVPISGILLYPSAPVPVIAAIFSRRRIVDDDEMYKRIGFASKRLMEEVCKWGIEKGMKAIDLSSLDPESSRVPGITEYKMSFAPAIVDRYIYEYASPTYAFLESLMIRLRNIQRSVFGK